METISLKLDGTMLGTMDATLKKHNYSTRTEFIRDAIREKLGELSKEEAFQQLLKLRGSVKSKYTDEEFERIRGKALQKLVSERGWD